MDPYILIVGIGVFGESMGEMQVHVTLLCIGKLRKIVAGIVLSFLLFFLFSFHSNIFSISYYLLSFF